MLQRKVDSGACRARFAPVETKMEMPRDLPGLDATLCGLRGATVTQVYEALAQQAALIAGVPETFLLSRLKEQERRATSGIGGGVAIPHLRLKKLRQPCTVLARLARPVDFGAVDRAPVDLVLLLLSPETGIAAHLQRLSRFSRLMRDPALCANLRNVADADGMAALMMETVAEKQFSVPRRAA